MTTRYIISICQGPDCTQNGSDALVPAAERLTRELGIAGACRIKRGGCYGLCDQGANVIVRPDLGGPVDPFGADDYELTYEPGEIHYAGMTPERLERVVREHLAEDRPVAELVGDFNRRP